MMLDYPEWAKKQEGLSGFRAPEAIRVDKRRLAIFSSAGPEPLAPLSRSGKAEQPPLPPMETEGQHSAARFRRQVAQCSEGFTWHLERQPALEQAIARYRRLGEKGQQQLAEALGELARLHHRQGGRREALRHYEESASILRRQPPSEAALMLARTLKHTGSIHYETQNLTNAARCFEEALHLTLQHAPPHLEAEKLEVAAIATLAGAIRLKEATEGPSPAKRRQATALITLAEQQLEGLEEKDHLVKKRSEELKYMKRILQELL